MPVITSNQVTQSLEDVAIRLGGAVDVSVRFTTPGFPDIIKVFTISEAEASVYWNAHPPEGVNRWEDLCGILYSILLSRGDIVGTFM